MQQSAGPAVLVTTRPLQNVHTGIDLSVPEYQEIHGKMMSGHVEYNIVVVTRLAAFKSAKHKPEDVIQFMVSKKYSEIDEFYQHLLAQYPHISLPPLPRKVLFVGESDIRERRVTFNEIMRAISRNEELAVSPDLLEFLGTKTSNIVDKKGKNLPDKEDEDEDFFKEEKPFDIISQFKMSKEQVTEVTEKEEEEEEEVDPLGVIKSKKTKKPTPPPVKEDKAKLTIFDEEIDPDDGLFGSAKDFSLTNKRLIAAGENLKLFEDPDLGGVVTLGDSLLLPTACENSKQALSDSLEEDAEELLRVEDDFEKMLKLTSKPKPKLPPKPVLPKKLAKTDTKLPLSSAQTAKTTKVKIQAMDEVDILQYIQDNESISSEEPSLF